MPDHDDKEYMNHEKEQLAAEFLRLLNRLDRTWSVIRDHLFTQDDINETQKTLARLKTEHMQFRIKSGDFLDDNSMFKENQNEC